MDKDCLHGLLAIAGPQSVLTLVTGREVRLDWSADDLQTRRLQAESVLRAQGLRAGDRVLLVSRNNPHCIALLLAAVSLGLCLCPLHPDQSLATLQHVLATQPPALAVLDDSALAAAVNGCPQLRLCEQDEDWLQGSCLPQTAVVTAVAGVVIDAAAFDDDLPLLLFHSSGSTGSPKGIRYTRGMTRRFFAALAQLYAAFPDAPGTSPPSPRVNVLPLTHFGGLGFCLQSLLEGRAVHLLRNAAADEHVALLAAQRCQLVLLVPSLWHELMQRLDAGALPALRHCLAMGEAIAAAQLQRLSQRLQLRVYNAYGMSECLTGIFNGADDADVPVGSCGRLRFGEARLLDADGRPTTGVGELCVRNATTVPCYTDPALNAARYRDGWFHTGDLLRRDANGHYFFVGRKDLMCVVHGRNVYPQEVEQVLASHPAVTTAVVVPCPKHDGRPGLAAVVALRPGAVLSATALLDFYLRNGAVYATPGVVVFVDEVPRLSGAKPDRQACAALVNHHRAGEVAA